MKFWILAFAVTGFASNALATPPDAPTITVAATDIKQLQFDITPVTRVGWYELWFKANDGAAWVKYSEQRPQRPLFRIGTSVHLLDWRQARYYVKACNPGGCGQSNEVRVDGEQLAAMGFLKPDAREPYSTNGQAISGFGAALAVSADGRVVVAGSGETVAGKDHSTAIYVFRRTSSPSGWRREARLVPSTPQRITFEVSVNNPVAVSADGNLIAYGIQQEEPEPVSPSKYNVGAVHLFRRDSTGWHEVQKIPGARNGDVFGTDVALDDAGRTLVVSHDSSATLNEIGMLDVYRMNDATGQFAYERTLPSAFATGRGACRDVSLSGDGNTLVRICRQNSASGGSQPPFVQVLNGPTFAESARIVAGDGIAVRPTRDGTRLLVQDFGGALVYKRAGAAWELEANLAGFRPNYMYRRHIDISADGKLAAIGYPPDTVAGRGPVYPPYDYADENGSVLVYERRATGWKVRRLVKPDSTGKEEFGTVVAFGDNGKLLAVGAPRKSSAASRVDGDREDTSYPDRGAVWLY
jgi:hypothetical protein